MCRHVLVVATALLLGLCGPAQAETLPSFHLDFSAWKASDVVVIDLDRRVVETWKGNLKVGDELPIKNWNLTEAADIDYDYWYRRGSERPKDHPARVTGKRRVVFLIRDASKSADDPKAWEPASIGKDIDTCAIWVEGELAFAVQQWLNPGPALMHPLRTTESKLKAEVTRSDQQQRALRSAAAETDPGKRAAGVVGFVRESNYLARNETLSILADCGDAAWPVIKPLILDEKELPSHSGLIHLLDKIHGSDSVAVIETIIGQEIQYWDSLSMKEQQTGAYNPPMHHHYDKLSACLFVLKRISYRDAKGIVAKLRDKWDSHPILCHLGSGGSDGRSPVLQYADEILKVK